jgi:hypothetical protein
VILVGVVPSANDEGCNVIADADIAGHGEVFVE